MLWKTKDLINVKQLHVECERALWIFMTGLPAVALCFRLSSLRPFPDSDSGNLGKWATAFLDFAAPGFRWWRSGRAPRGQKMTDQKVFTAICTSTQFNSTYLSWCLKSQTNLMCGYFDAANYQRTLRGFSLRYGGSPSTISIAMMPRDQMSTLGP